MVMGDHLCDIQEVVYPALLALYGSQSLADTT
jgi:hypothetical protein